MHYFSVGLSYQSLRCVSYRSDDCVSFSASEEKRSDALSAAWAPKQCATILKACLVRGHSHLPLKPTLR